MMRQTMEVEVTSCSDLDHSQTRVSPLKRVCESARERETFRYDPSLLFDESNEHHPANKPESEIATSSDTILTALSQLGAYQTGSARSFISLFDRTYQYIIAETTPGLPLISGLKQEEIPGEKLWVCGTAVRREEGVCEYTLCADHPEQFGDEISNNADQLPFIFVRDLTSDPRFACKPYCRPGSPARFYAAVPIRTPKGINIGVYCVIDSDVGKEWTPRKTQQMRTISKSIMDYLVARSRMPKHNRSIRMNRGLGSFMEGKATVSGESYDPEKTIDGDTKPEEGVLNEYQQNLARQSQEDLSKPMPIQGMTERWPYSPVRPSLIYRPSSDGMRLGTGKLRTSGDSKSSYETIRGIFSRAANIIRESIEVEGCVFFDAQVKSFGGLSAPSEYEVQDSQLSSSQSGSDDVTMSDAPLPHCDILGFSTSSSSSIDGVKTFSYPDSIPERVLQKLSQRYPKGRIFNFDHNGELMGSDLSEDDQLQPPSPFEHNLTSNSPPASKRSSKPWARRREASTIIKAFPGARSVAFVPIWDAKKERWWAGTFAYTCTPTRTFTVEGELSYLRAFGMLAMAETFASESLQANRAKSDVLGSISHELRSPLHGIVLAVELLHDSDLSAFQGNIVHTIETCSRTLTDTVDHLLDFTKINTFIELTKPRRNPGELFRGLRDGRRGSIEAGMKSLYADVWIDSLAEEVMESVFAGFNFQHASVAQFQRQSSRARHEDARANRKLDYMYAMEELGPKLSEKSDGGLHLGKVGLSLDIDPSCSWNFYTQPGAVRRIIMNLFGNSLKYTHEGTINVRLRQASTTRATRMNERIVIITVADTGIGMSQDYMRNNLFKPFQQEDHLSPGTGLGLSIVKKIATQLKGTISVESRPNIGTTISVSIPMVQVLMPSPGPTIPPAAEDKDFRQQVAELKGLRVRLVGLDGDKSRTSWGTNYGAPHSVCREWLQLEVIADKEHPFTSKAPDLLLVAEEAMHELGEPSPRDPPSVVVCPNAIVAHERALEAKTGDGGGVFEFISQPLGPRKIAKIVFIAFKRWVAAQDPVMNTPPDSGTPKVLPRARLHSVEFPIPQPAIPITPSGASPSPLGSPEAKPTDHISPSGSPLKQESRMPSPTTVPEPHFLLVDDNHINLKILSTYVKKLGYTCDMALDGQEALNMFVANPSKFSCIFMDISMPVMDGFEATRRIRAFERETNRSNILIFALSGLASNEAQQEAFGSGIDLFLSKPVTLKELGSILKAKDLL